MNTCIFFLASLLTATPPLHIDQTTVDGGEWRSARPWVHRFQLKNTTGETLTITEVVGSCGCLRRDLAARELAPNATTELTLVINVLAAPAGPNTWRATVRYRTASATGEQTVQMTAKVVKDVTVEPVSLFLSTEKATSATITLTDRRAKPLTITGVRIGVKDVRGTVQNASDDRGKRTQQVTITVPETCPAGAHVDEVCLDTNDPDCPELRIPLRLMKKTSQQGIEALPAQPMIRFAKDQESASALIRLRDADGKEVQIDAIDADHEAITSKWAAGPGPMATLRINMDRRKLNATGSTVVTVRLRSPTKESILIPISWTLP